MDTPQYLHYHYCPSNPHHSIYLTNPSHLIQPIQIVLMVALVVLHLQLSNLMVYHQSIMTNLWVIGVNLVIVLAILQAILVVQAIMVVGVIQIVEVIQILQVAKVILLIIQILKVVLFMQVSKVILLTIQTIRVILFIQTIRVVLFIQVIQIAKVICQLLQAYLMAIQINLQVNLTYLQLIKVYPLIVMTNPQVSFNHLFIIYYLNQYLNWAMFENPSHPRSQRLNHNNPTWLKLSYHHVIENHQVQQDFLLVSLVNPPFADSIIISPIQLTRVYQTILIINHPPMIFVQAMILRI